MIDRGKNRVLSRFTEEMKEGKRIYKETYEPYASNHDLLGTPHTVYTLEPDGGIFLEDAYEGSLGIESKVRISAFNNSNLEKYEVPKTLTKIVYDTENILMQCGEKIHTIQFPTAAEFALKVKDLNFGALSAVFNNIFLSQIMFRYPGIENKMKSSNLNNANFDQIKGVIPKDGIFKDITTLFCDTGSGNGIMNSNLGTINMSSVARFIDVTDNLLYSCQVKRLVVTSNLLNAGFTIANNCTIKLLEIDGDVKSELLRPLFLNCTIEKIVCTTKKIPSRMFEACTIGSIQFWTGATVSKGVLTKTPLEYIENSAFVKTIFVSPFSIAVKECQNNMFSKCIFQSRDNFIFTDSKITPIEGISVLPYDIKIIRMSPQQQKLYAKADEILYKLRHKQECKPY